MGWIFREQPFEDYGVDAQAEVVDGEQVLGRLLGLQIKGGASYFSRPAEDGWWFRERAAHFQYWLNYSIPVLVVLCDLDSGLCHWQLVTESVVEGTSGKEWKLLVPRSQVLDDAAAGPLREAAEAWVLKVRDRPLDRPVAEFDVADLEVHSALPGIGTASQAPPEYVIRSHDRMLDDLIAGSLGPAAKSGITVLVGGSCAGKTRALYEALHRPVMAGSAESSLADAGWRLWPAINPLPPARFLDELASVGPRTVVWLNEAQRYLRDPSTELRARIATGLIELLADESRGPVLVLGTLWPEHWQQLTRMPDRNEPDEFAAVRRLLNGNYLRVPDTFTNAELNAARTSSDLRLAVAADRGTGTGVTQYLAGAPDLVQRYETTDTLQQAIIHAAMDARRLGHAEWFSAEFLCSAARSFLADPDLRRLDDGSSWFDKAIEDLVIPGKASGPMLHESVLGYRLDDFLDQEGRARRRFEFPPEEFWSVVADSDLPSDSLVRMADSAASRLRLQIAARLYELAGTKAAGERLRDLALRCQDGKSSQTARRLAYAAAAAGVPHALTELVSWRRGTGPGDLEMLRDAANLGDLTAFARLAYHLEVTGDREQAEAVAQEAVARGSWQATVDVAEWRYIDEPEEAVQLLYDLPLAMRPAALADLVTSLEGVDDFEGAEEVARSAAANGYIEGLLALADYREDRGDKTGARQLLRDVTATGTVAGDLRMAEILARAGDHAKARRLLKRVAGPVKRAQRGVGNPEALVDRLAAFIQARPDTADQLFTIVEMLDERDWIPRLSDARQRALTDRRSQPGLWGETENDLDEAEDDLDEPEDEYEVARAYATLAGFHAKHGDFPAAEELALRAAAAGNPEGLEVLSRELLDNGDHAAAERQALRAVNMTEAAPGHWTSGSARETLAAAREDETLLVSGLDADGATTTPW